jgi:hypothetical protein
LDWSQTILSTHLFLGKNSEHTSNSTNIWLQIRKFCGTVRIDCVVPFPSEPCKQSLLPQPVSREVCLRIMSLASLICAKSRAFADFVLGSLVLHFFVYNFLGWRNQKKWLRV